MRTQRSAVVLAMLAIWVLAGLAEAQQSKPAPAEPGAPGVSGAASPGQAAPRLVKFSGVLKDPAGKPLVGVQGVTFALYKEPQGGAPLWLETQNVEVDEQGSYTALLGATKSEGMPVELFASGESRWLGVQPQLPGEEELPRVLLVSVPYALRAADADTVGGKPASAFLLAPEGGRAGGTAAGAVVSTQGVAGPAVTSGTAGYLGVFVNTTDLGNSALFQLGGNIGLGTTSPQAPLHIASIQPYRNLNLGSLQTGAYPGIMLENTSTSGSVALTENSGLSLYIKPSTSADLTAADLKLVVNQSGNLGLGTSTPAQKLDVAGNVNASGQLISSVSTGTAPLAVSSTTAVTNLNADLVDGFHAAAFVAKAGDTMIGALTLPADGLVVGTNQLTAGNGNVAVGTSTSPAVRMRVQGASNTPMAFALSVTNTDGVAGLEVRNDLNVGIGTSGPTEKLEVNGNVKANAIKFADGTTQTTAGVNANTALNLQQVALLRWYGANQAGASFTAGFAPFGVAFDGANIWVANNGSNNVTKLRPSDGSTLGTFTVGTGPKGVAFDGANIWVANTGSNNVTKLRASDGTVLGTFTVGGGPFGVAFDGANIWVANFCSGTVSKL